jgi:hypothetical protein
MQLFPEAVKIMPTLRQLYCQRGHPVPEARRFASETSERISQSEGATSPDKTRGITAILKIEATHISSDQYTRFLLHMYDVSTTHALPLWCVARQRQCDHASISIGRALACVFISASMVCGLASSETSSKDQRPSEVPELAIKR